MSSLLAVPDAETLFKRMVGRKILVVGDLMIDEWIWGSVSRISPEAPVPVVAVDSHSFTLGGAGNVAHNLRELGAVVDFVGCVGDDSFGDDVRRMLKDENVGNRGIFSATDRPTTRKTRIVAQHQQVVRADWETTTTLSPRDNAAVVGYVSDAAKASDAVILSDYAKGLLGFEVVQAAKGCPLVLADPKPQNIEFFKGVTCVAPNVHEASLATGIAIKDQHSLERAGTALLDKLDCKYVVITRGEHGMSLFGKDGARLDVPSVARNVYDVSGAGDTVIAVLALALSAGASIEDAMRLANFAAGAVVEKLGTATAAAQEILALVEHEHA